MKRKIICISIISMFLLTGTLVVSAGKLTTGYVKVGQDTELLVNEDEMVSISTSDVLITIDDITELKKARDMLENPDDQQALDEVIASVEKNGEATYADLEEILSGSNFGKVTVSGTFGEWPNFGGPFRLMFGFQVVAPSAKLITGTVEVGRDPDYYDAPCTVTMSYFLGYWNLQPGNVDANRIYMNGFGLGINVDNQNLIKNLVRVRFPLLQQLLLRLLAF